MMAWRTATGRTAAVLLTAVLLISLSACSPDAEPAIEFVQPPSCPAGQGVTSAGELSAALSSAEPGAVIVLADATYSGEFTITRSGTADAPITLCAGPGAVLDGGSTDHGYTLHLDGASFWVIDGLTVSGGQKGVMLDRSSNNQLTGLSISGTGDEGLHLRAGSSDNLVEGSTISGTGLRSPEFGEGIYVGTAESNWCDISDCAPDASDRNRLLGNSISATPAESIDVKEGTTGGEIRDNRVDGAGTTAVDSLLDVKGSEWLVTGNTGTAAPIDGAQVHVILAGWGAGNRFSANTFAVASDGYAVLLEGAARSAGNVVECDNVATVSGAPVPAFTTNGTCRTAG
ncbi:MAG: hypothetical protein EPO52_15685 [Herbiconiux sp.]|uniref:right-handed parallel beta-helix repeat-containing protein n=1 Tax=Herbiconiux sp. TaxID=1871186 RepID=UPI00122B1930|nr:right-handed parallel beta-helix repeat-containing protein [Herbiconiux sp.]TAJ46453.1 MAG: hypothetical protein EPO52_15685 [Herbiconiux sp.]